MRNNKGYRQLIAWQKCSILAHLIYDITMKFPNYELFGITSQMRRSALSACANIAEGYSRSSKKDRKHFYQMTTASLTELEFFLDFSYERKYIHEAEYQTALSSHTEAARVLSGLLKST
jgi:four helix bundle protein